MSSTFGRGFNSRRLHQLVALKFFHNPDVYRDVFYLYYLLFIVEKNNFQVKKVFFIFLAVALMAGSLSAQQTKEVLLKFSKQEGQMRIVLEAEETFLKKTEAVTLPSQIKVKFPGPFNLISQKNFPLDIVSEDKLLVIKLEKQSEIKISRLSSPARIVFDIQKGEKQSAPILSKVFVFDAGHGGYDFGMVSGDMREKDISLDLVKDLNTILSKKGKKVFLTRKVDQYMPLIERIKFVNQKAPDVFISFHSSMSENFILYIPVLENQGIDEVVDSYSLSLRQKKYMGKSKALSESIGKAIKDEFKVNVVYRSMPLPLINSTGAPSAVIELPSPKFMVYDLQTKTRLINSIVNGIAAYGQ